MARGSSGGLSGGSSGNVTAIEMAGGGGGVSATGKQVINKKYFVTNSQNLDVAPKIDGYNATQISYVKINESAYEQSVTYESLTEASTTSAGGVVWLQNGVKGTFEMFCSFEMINIERHPRIESIKEKYGGQLINNRLTFPMFLPGNLLGQDSGLSSAGVKKNPMFGIEYYKEATLTLRHTYFTKVINASIWDLTGKVVTKLPAGIPVPRGEKDDQGKEIPREFMIQAPALSRQGDAWQVVLEYVMLKSSALATEMYEKGTTPGAP
jgi:hypothetical protein